MINNYKYQMWYSIRNDICKISKYKMYDGVNYCANKKNLNL